MFVILLFSVCAVCSTICSCFRLCAHIHAFQVFLIRDFYQIQSDMSFLKYVLNNWSCLCKMLATLTTIATPRCSEGAGISGDVGHVLGPLFVVIFTSMVQIYFMLLLFIRFAITHAAILFS